MEASTRYVVRCRGLNKDPDYALSELTWEGMLEKVRKDRVVVSMPRHRKKTPRQSYGVAP
jgi:hypothetical protein